MVLGAGLSHSSLMLLPIGTCFYDGVWYLIWGFIFILLITPDHNLIINFEAMICSRAMLSISIFINLICFTLVYEPPIGYMLNWYDHIYSKY